MNSPSQPSKQHKVFLRTKHLYFQSAFENGYQRYLDRVPNDSVSLSNTLHFFQKKWILLPVPQFQSVHPGAQRHSNAFTLSWHVPPFLQGDERHSL